MKKLPPPYCDIPARCTDPNVYNTTLSQSSLPNSKMATINTYVVRSILAYAGLLEDGVSVIGIIGDAGSSTTWIAAEHDLDDGGVVLANYFWNAATEVCRLEGVQLSAGGQRRSQFPAFAKTKHQQNESFDKLPIYLVLLETAREVWPHTFGKDFDSAVKNAKDLGSNTQIPEADIGLLYRVCHSFYALVNGEKIPVPIPGGNVAPMRKDALEDSTLADATLYLGKAPYINGNKPATFIRKNPRTFGEAKQEFLSQANAHIWTADEQALIPTFPDDYPIAPEALKIARRYVKTHGNKQPMVNFLWRGITSYGKSTGVKMLAALLHMPLVRMTCHSTMETQNFLSEFVPDNGDRNLGTVPTVEQMFLDPEGCYEEITGESKAGATPDDCLKKLMANAANSDGTARFKHVESNYVKALARGWIVEIQEFSRIRDPGVLVGLNEYDAPGAIVPLVDGSYVRRHKDAICVYTDNVNYVSCRPVDPSVIRRMAIAIDSYELPKTTVFARVKYNTGMEDMKLLETMYRTWLKIDEYCRAHDITEGPVSVTELEMWAACVLADNGENVYQNCVECVVAKATSNIEEQKEIKSAVLDVCLTK